MIAANDEKAILKLAIELKEKSIPYDGIAARLNDEGFQTATGTQWTASSVSSLMVKNGIRKRPGTSKSLAKAAVRNAVKRAEQDDLVETVIELLKMEKLSPERRIKAALHFLEEGAEQPIVAPGLSFPPNVRGMS